tara:strand:- start:197 stop:454 length:258 start_codon:yes stop_codon:yes gene_type:complete
MKLKQRDLINDNSLSTLSNIRKACISYINNNPSIFQDIKTQDELIDLFINMAHKSMVNTKNNTALTSALLKGSFRTPDNKPVKVL